MTHHSNNRECLRPVFLGAAIGNINRWFQLLDTSLGLDMNSSDGRGIAGDRLGSELANLSCSSVSYGGRGAIVEEEQQSVKAGIRRD